MKKLISMFLCFMMTFSFFGGASNVMADNVVASIGNNNYESMQEAINQAKDGDEIVQLADIKGSKLEFAEGNKNITWNMNGHTYESIDRLDVLKILGSDLTLTIKNGTLKSEQLESYGVYAYEGADNLSLLLDNITFSTPDQTVGVQGLNSNQNVTIQNSDITSVQSTAIYFPPKSGTLTINNSTVTAVNQSLVIKGGNVIIRGDNTRLETTGEAKDYDGPYQGGSTDFPKTGNAIYVEDGYKDYLTTMAQWYEEGLIDPNFVANDASSNAPFEYSASDRTGAFSTAYGFMGTAFYSDMHMVDNDQYCLTAVNNPVLNSGDTPECLTLPTISASSYAISTSCDNPELAARWLDYQFSQDAFMLNSFGIEGETYTVGEDGTVTLADSVIHPEQEGISSSDYFATLVPAYNWPGLISMETQEDFVGDELRLEARDVWSSDGTDMVIPSRVSMTSEESSDYMAAYTSIQTYVQEMTTKFIMGTESIDDQWDNYVSTIDSLGIDTCIQYQQAALDRYNER